MIPLPVWLAGTAVASMLLFGSFYQGETFLTDWWVVALASLVPFLFQAVGMGVFWYLRSAIRGSRAVPAWT